MTRYAGVKGMSDLLPPATAQWQRIERVAHDLFPRFGFSEIRTPVVEDTALFVRSVGEGTDIVGKEMYTFDDKGGRSITLRPEGTAPAARAYIEHALANKEPLTRWFYLGPMFRYERMKTGRYRQFHQLGAEAYGSADPAQDVEVMELCVRYLEALGLKGVVLQLNSLGDSGSRGAWSQRVAAHFEPHRAAIGDEAVATLAKNPLRLLDSKDPAVQAVAATAPLLMDSLDDASRAHFAEVQKLLRAVGVEFALNPRLVRGLDYYTRTAFELIADHPALGTASAVGGGGRYDDLVSQLGGHPTPAIGFALGLDRLALLLDAQSAPTPERPELFVAIVDATTKVEAMTLVSSLRQQGITVDVDTRLGSLKSQMKRADKVAARYSLVVGDHEAKTRRAALKPMDGGEPTEVGFDGLAEWLRARRSSAAGARS